MSNNTQTSTPVIDFTDLSQWKTLDEIEELFPNFKKSTIRWLIRQKEINGLDKIIKKIGRLNIVHVPAFSVWISEQ
jgi:hypothetical protein